MSNAYINLTTLLSARGYDKGMYFTHEECSSLVSLINARDSRIAELEAYIDQLIEIGGWAITGMTIATSYSPGEMQNLAEKKSDDWYALIKNLKECDKKKEREE